MTTLRSEVFCDFLTVTAPRDSSGAILDCLRPYLSALGCEEKEGCFRPAIGDGLFSCRVRHAVVVFTASGGFLSCLRSSKLLANFLAELYAFPHRVSSADFTCDEYVDSPPRLDYIYGLAVSGSLRFTRKAIDSRHVREIKAQVAYNDSGLKTGTVYIGKRGIHEVHAKVYDKRQQLYLEKGVDSPPTLRHELTVSSKMGISLRDVAEPHNCFYHFYPSNLLSRAFSVEWVGVGEGYSLNKPPERLPAHILKAAVESSRELEYFFRLADKVSPTEAGLTYLLQLIKQRYACEAFADRSLLVSPLIPEGA